MSWILQLKTNSVFPCVHSICFPYCVPFVLLLCLSWSGGFFLRIGAHALTLYHIYDAVYPRRRRYDAAWSLRRCCRFCYSRNTAGRSQWEIEEFYFWKKDPKIGDRQRTIAKMRPSSKKRCKQCVKTTKIAKIEKVPFFSKRLGHRKNWSRERPNLETKSLDQISRPNR